MDYAKMTIRELSTLLRSKELSAEELCRKSLASIEKQESELHAFLTVDGERALSQAREIDRKRMNGEELAELVGIPCAIKDNICTEGLKTTCASKILYNFVPPYDATVIRKLKEENALIIGKTNLDEFAMGSSTENSGFAPSHNPWNTECVPGGSSGGSAVAVASGEVTFALGSDTGGSVRQPAAYCGVIGLKPTYGAVSRFGLIAYASSLDQIGPLTKDVTDAALVFNAIKGHDPLDSTSAPGVENDYLQASNSVRRRIWITQK